VAPDPLPAGVAALVARLHALRPGYAALAPTSPVAAETTADIDAIADRTVELFRRLTAPAARGQAGVAEVEYTDKLARLLVALDPDYLRDLLVRPDFWDEPDERIREVRDGMRAVADQLLANIRQVNARKALAFQVSLDSLTGREELKDWERAFD